MSEVDLKHFSLFQEVSDPERLTVVDLLEPLELDEDEPLWNEGQEADGLVLVEAGELEVMSARAGRLGTISAGGWLGALSLVVVGPREASVTATRESVVYMLTREAFRRLVLDSPHVGFRILEATVSDLSQVMRLGLDKLVEPSLEE